MCCVYLGVYGDVHRVKILFNKKDNALIQMAEPHQAQLGRNYLQYLKFTIQRLLLSRCIIKKYALHMKH